MFNALCLEYAQLPWVDPRERRSCTDELEMVIVCSECPVCVECGTYARAHGITSGFWAGQDRDARGDSLEQDGAA